MMKPHRFVVAALVSVALVTATDSAPAESTQLEGIIPFAEALVVHQFFMLEDDERVLLRDLHGRLVDADKRAREGENEATKVLARRELALVVEAWVRQLESSRFPVRIEVGENSAVPATSSPRALPGDYGSVLLRVGAGRGPNRFLVFHHPMRQPAYSLDVPCNPRGTTWILLLLEDLPTGRTTLALSLQRDPLPPVPHLLTVETPPLGRLQLTVLSDDTGKPTPARVRLVSRRTGRDVPPPNALELSRLLDGQGNPASQRKPFLPGVGDVRWWIVPGPFAMALSPGEYDLEISRGTEHAPVAETITIDSGEGVSLTKRPARWIYMRERGWFSGDVHVHGQMLSDTDAAMLMAWIQAEDVHLANVCKMGDVHRTWFEQRGFGPEFRVRDGDHVLCPGQECPRTPRFGHVLTMNTRSMVRDVDHYMLYDRVADAVHAQGGLFGFAHLVGGEWNRGGAGNVQGGLTLWAPGGHVDFVEVMQFGGFGPDLWYEFLDLGIPLTACSGSDVPWGGTVGEGRVYAFLGEEEFTADAWFDAVRAGHTFVSNGPMIEFRVNDALPGDVLPVEQGQTLRVSAQAWGHLDVAPLERLELIRWGEVIASASPEAEHPNQVTLETTVDAGHGMWLAARAIGANGSVAHTTPVYVQREGLRWWDYADAGRLIELRLASLKEMETKAEEAKAEVAKAEAAGCEVPYQDLQAMGEQADAFLVGVAGARTFYEGLKHTAEREALLRAE